jgi:serine/threonine-protein kinase HipA
MTARDEEFQVRVDIGGATLRAGTVWFTRGRRGGISTVFRYDDAYIATPQAYNLDPTFPFDSGSHHVSGLPAAFADSSPDRWGRQLITKAAAQDARDRGERARTLDDVDFLLGVSDATRHGAIRFATLDGDLLGGETQVPQLLQLGELLHAADGAATDDMASIKRLLDTGTGGLGGANPKALVQTADGRLAIAKFPHPHDDYDVIGWEAIALELAGRAGIPVPARQLLVVDGRHVLVVDRFDRGADGERVGYMSALTAVGRAGDEYDYADVAAAMWDLGIGQTALRDFYDRLVLSVAVHNTDDHLRNHGLLHAPEVGGWTPAPLFDVNPIGDDATERTTAIAGATRIDDEPDALLDIAEDFRLKPDAARERIARVAGVVSGWRDVATEFGVALDADIAAVIDSTTTHLRALAS